MRTFVPPELGSETFVLISELFILFLKLGKPVENLFFGRF
jgi:hypothetical protein